MVVPTSLPWKPQPDYRNTGQAANVYGHRRYVVPSKRPRPGFSHTIFPKSHEAFDLLCVGTYRRPVEPGWTVPAASGAFEGPPIALVDQGVYLNSALDV